MNCWKSITLCFPFVISLTDLQDWKEIDLYLLIIRIMDEMGHEMENAESKMDSTLKKMAKVMHMSNGNPFIQLRNNL